MTIGDAFDRTAAKHAARPALRVVHQNIRFAPLQLPVTHRDFA